MEMKLNQRSHQCPENARKSVSLLSDPVQLPDHHLSQGLLVVLQSWEGEDHRSMGENIETCLVMIKH